MNARRETKDGRLGKPGKGVVGSWLHIEYVCTLVQREVDNGLPLCTQQLLGTSDKITGLPYDIIHTLHPKTSFK